MWYESFFNLASTDTWMQNLTFIRDHGEFFGMQFLQHVPFFSQIHLQAQ
jgi:hypothetical protein